MQPLRRCQLSLSVSLLKLPHHWYLWPDLERTSETAYSDKSVTEVSLNHSDLVGSSGQKDYFPISTIGSTINQINDAMAVVFKKLKYFAAGAVVYTALTEAVILYFGYSMSVDGTYHD